MTTINTAPFMLENITPNLKIQRVCCDMYSLHMRSPKINTNKNVLFPQQTLANSLFV